MNLFNGSFFDKEYFENGTASKKSCYDNFSYMPLRSAKEAVALLEYSGAHADSKSWCLDVGCAKGFLVRAIRNLGFACEGCDISDYALRFTPSGCWDCSTDDSWFLRKCRYDYAFVKDVFEHCNKDSLILLLNKIAEVAKYLTCVVPMGNNGRYVISSYHKDPSHYIAEDENWWYGIFIANGWRVLKHCKHVSGLKDNYKKYADGNHVYHMVRV